MADELLDLVNEKDEVIGTVWKSEAHKDPTLIHREVAIAVFNDKGEILIQQGSMNKTINPGAWKTTAAGHVESGENVKNAAERELLEELGLKVDMKYFKKVFAKRVGQPGRTESRFFYIYYAVVGENKKLKLNRREVMDTKWINPDDLEGFAKENDWEVDGLSHRIIMEVQEHLDL